METTYTDTRTDAEAACIDSALSVLRRRLSSTPVTHHDISCPEALRQYLALKVGAERIEHFGIMFLDSQFMLIGDAMPFTGGVASVWTDITTVLREALLNYASGIVVYHNHPSGTCYPSDPDIAMTRKLKSGCDAIGVELVDHVIVSGEKLCSLRTMGVF